jgi:hypothetical protein
MTSNSQEDSGLRSKPWQLEIARPLVNCNRRIRRGRLNRGAEPAAQSYVSQMS